MNAVPLSDATEDEHFGGKAASLARALRAGLPVPGGFALPAPFVRRVVGGDDRAIDLALELFRQCGAPVSVRSSAIGEDSAGASFAGQHLTVLNVVSEDQFLEAIRQVHASASNDGAAQYRERMAVAGEAEIAIVVQRMVNSDSAGVLFTRNPLSGEDERVIEAAWGLGEAVVSGAVTPDRFRLRKSGEIIERIAGFKDIEIRFADAGTTELPVDDGRVRQLCLNDAQLAELHRLAALCERELGGELDLEWAFEGDRLYLLQARPITRIAGSCGTGVSPVPLVSGLSNVGESGTNETPVPRESTTLTARRLTGFALAAILSPLNSTMIAVALPEIGASFGASAASLTLWLVSAYLLVSIIAQSPAGKLSDLYGYSRILTIGRALFAAGAIAGALAPSIAVLALARVAMAVGGSFNIPTVMAELRREVPPHQRGRIFGFMGALMGTAAAIGPLVGGALIPQLGWHSVFFVNLPLIALSLVLEPLQRSEVKERRDIRFDWSGSILFAIAISLVVGGMQSRSVTGLSIVMAGVVLIALFVLYERRISEPLIDPSLFRSSVFSAGGSIVGLQNFAMYAILFLIPFLLKGAGLSAASMGTFLLAMTGGMVVCSPVGGKLTDKIGPRATAVLGAVVGASGCVLVTLQGRGESLLAAGLALLGAGIGLSTSPSQTAAMSAIGPAQAGAAAGALSTMRYLGGVLGSGFVAILVARTGSQPLMWIFPIAMMLSGVVAFFLPMRVERETRPSAS